MKRRRNCWYLVCEYNWRVLWYVGDGWAVEDTNRHGFSTHKTCWNLSQAIRNATKIEALGGRAEILRRFYDKGTLCHQLLYLKRLDKRRVGDCRPLWGSPVGWKG